MELEELESKVNASPALRELRDRCMTEMSFRMDNSAQFGIILILSLISVAIQVATYCKNKNKAELKQDIRNIRTLPPRKLMRLRRRANKLWREEFPNHPVNPRDPNPMLTVMYELGETADDAALDELLALANVPD
ncbi:hypothetical protein [Sphingorhabdus sp.]|uniref:hypothetical protein n=1 Tax=Sphingorhabdus sp. TaxID=1902408 RepID=UPI00334199FA